MKISSATAEIEAPVPLKKDAKKGQLYIRQHSRHKINRWYTTRAVKRNSKLDTTTTNKVYASSSKTKNNVTELSKVVWNAKGAGETPLIECSIVKRVPPYQCGSKICQLCLAEKMSILQADKKNLLNKRSELVSKCRHINKFLLKNVRLKA